MVELREGGDLPNIPDESGVYVIVCVFGGNSSYRLGDILYIGVTNSLRRRIAYALAAPGKSSPHSVQEPLLRFQSRGGVAKVLFCLLDQAVSEDELEQAMMKEYQRRTRALPHWNKAQPGTMKIRPILDEVSQDILDKLNVRP
jgi:hypothetical protein